LASFKPKALSEDSTYFDKLALKTIELYQGAKISYLTFYTFESPR